MVRAICLAALRLTTNSNFVGCSTGRSAGFVPLRISQKRKNLALGALNIIWKLDCGDVLPRQIWDIGNRFWAKISGFELARLSSLDAPQALLKTLHLFFHDRHLDIHGLMKLHEPIDMGCKSINAILHDRESLVHFLSEITNIKLDQPKSAIYLAKSFVDLPEPRARLLKSSPNKPFKSCKALINGSSFLCRFRLGHLSYLAALSPYKSQDLKSELFDHPIRPPDDFRLFGHRITLSALAKTLGGIVNPICFAALKSITSVLLSLA